MAVGKWCLFAVVVYTLVTMVSASSPTCPDKWKSWGKSCYLIVTPSPTYDPDQSKWDDARQHCLKKGSDLLSLTTEREVNFIYGHTKNLKYSFWIGFNKREKTKAGNRPWVWSNGDKRSITKWNKNEPSDDKNEYCVEILKGLKYWNNKECDEKRAWICKRQQIEQKTTPNLVKTVPETVTLSKKTQSVTFFPSSPTKELRTTTKTSTEGDSKPTKDESSDSGSISSTSLALFIFLPLIFLALIIVITLLVRKNRADRKTSEISREQENQMNRQNRQNRPNGQSNHVFRPDTDGYTDLHQNREPDNTYISLGVYESPETAYVIGNSMSYIDNGNVITTPQASERQRGFSYVIPPPYTK